MNTVIDRPFRILGIQQIAVGGPSKEKLRRLWLDMFGLALTGSFVSERENVDEDIAVLGGGPFRVEVDLMQPLHPRASDEFPICGEGVLIELVQAPPQVVAALAAAG